MGLRRRQLGADEQVVVEVRRGIGRLVTPLVTVVVSLGVAGFALVTAGRPSMSHASWLEIGAGAAAAVMAGSLLWLVSRYCSWRAETVAVTPERLVLSRGVLRRQTDQVLLARVADAHVAQRLTQRLVGRGDLVVELSDGAAVVVEGLREPDSFQRVLLRQAGLGESQTITPRPAGTPQMLVVTEFDPTPPRGTLAVSAISSTADLIRLDEIDRLEAEGALDRREADLRRRQITEGR